MDGVAGHAGLFSNALDPLRLAGMHAGRRRRRRRACSCSLRKRSRYLRRAIAREPPGTSRALGWDTPSVPSSSGRFFSQRSIGHLGFTGTSLWIDLDAGIAVTLLTNRTWPDRFNQAIRELRPRFHDTLRHELAADQKS